MINKLFYRFGSWGICFTYGTWFAIEGLSAVGQSYGNSTCIRKACKFLLTKQLKNGGWGESHLSSRTKVTISSMLLQRRWTASFIKNQAKECFRVSNTSRQWKHALILFLLNFQQIIGKKYSNLYEFITR